MEQTLRILTFQRTWLSQLSLKGRRGSLNTPTSWPGFPALGVVPWHAFSTLHRQPVLSPLPVVWGLGAGAHPHPPLAELIFSPGRL